MRLGGGGGGVFKGWWECGELIEGLVWKGVEERKGGGGG